jgi:hypothetical protein
MIFGGFGGRNGPSWIRFVRLGLLALILILGATLHDRGSTYNTIHIVYLVVVVALLIGTVIFARGLGRSSSRGRGLQRGRGRYGPSDDAPVGSGSFGTAPSAPGPTSSAPPPPPPRPATTTTDASDL